MINGRPHKNKGSSMTEEMPEIKTVSTGMSDKKMKACKSCGTQISKKASACPQCGRKNGMPTFLKVVIIFAILVIVTWIGIAACTASFVSSVDEAFNPKATVDGVNDTAQGDGDNGKEDLTNLAVGTVIDLRGLKVSVDAVKAGPTNLSGKATTEVVVTYTNNSNETKSFNAFDWKIEDVNGVRTTFDAFSGAEYLSSGDLAVGGTISGSIFFEVSESEAAKIVYLPSFLTSDDNLIFWAVR